MAPAAKYGDFPLKDYLRMEIEGVAAGRARASIKIGSEHLNPNGVVHGAVLFAMVDTAMGKATMSLLPDGQFCTSVEVQLRFLRPSSCGPLVAEASVLKQGKSIVHLGAHVHGDDDRVIATASGTFAILEN